VRYYLFSDVKVLLGKPNGSQLVKEFPAFFGPRKFISAFNDPATCPYPEPDKSSPYPLIPLPEDSF
jgi:hypothetical protein